MRRGQRPKDVCSFLSFQKTLAKAHPDMKRWGGMDSPVRTTEERATGIVVRLVDAGHTAYFVGGAVRDKLMGREPVDIDIATSAPQDIVTSLFEHTVPLGKEFGVVIVVIDKEPFEVATFRTEGPYEDGRRPSWVRSADARADVARRDFTLNGLLFDPVQKEVLDWVDGEKDIRNHWVRSIGEPHKRFSEDKLRLLRAIRFASNLDFQIEDETGRALRDMAGEITVVSAERIRVELTKIFTGPRPDRGLSLLDEYGLLDRILPEVARMKGVKQGELHHPEGDVFVHTRKILSLLSKPTVSLAFAALLHDVGKPPTCQPDGPVMFPNHAKVGADMSRDILNRLRFDGRTRELVVDAVANHLRFLDVKKMRPSTLRRFMSSINFAEQHQLHRLDCLAGNGDLSNWEFVKEQLEQLEREPLPPAPLLGGKDLLELGFQPGPDMGRILHEVEEMRLEGVLTTKEEAAHWVLEHYRPDVEKDSGQ